MRVRWPVKSEVSLIRCIFADARPNGTINIAQDMSFVVGHIRGFQFGENLFLHELAMASETAAGLDDCILAGVSLAAAVVSARPSNTLSTCNPFWERVLRAKIDNDVRRLFLVQ